MLVVDAYVNFEWGRSDAPAVEYGLTPWSMEPAVPYSVFDGAESHSDAWAVWKARQVV